MLPACGIDADTAAGPGNDEAGAERGGSAGGRVGLGEGSGCVSLYPASRRVRQALAKS